jgi:hypothetical protein
LNPWLALKPNRQLAALSWYMKGAFGKDDAQTLQSTRAVCMELAAGIWARFELKYHSWPYRLFTVPTNDDENILLNQSFFNASPCCLDAWLSEPLRSRLTCFEDLDEPSMVQLRIELGRGLAKATNMELEGLLSEIKASVPFSRRSPNSEKLAYLASLGERMKRHLASGLRDTRGPLPRSELLASNVPLENQRPVGSARPGPWVMAELAKFKRDNPQASASAITQKSAELRQSRPECPNVGRDLPDDDLPDEDLPDEDLPKREAGDYFEAGDDKWPIREQVLGSFVHSHPSHSAAGVAGFAQKASTIRKDEAHKLLVLDGGDIPLERVYSHRHSCLEAHPGLCVRADAAIYHDALALGKSLEACLGPALLHQYLHISCLEDSTLQISIFL